MVYALTLFLLVLPVAAINNKYYRNGFRSLLHRAPNMDSLIALAPARPWPTGSTPSTRSPGAWAAATWPWWTNSPTTSISRERHHPDPHHSGKFFEARAKGRTSDAINKLLDLAPKKATVLRDGAETVIPAEEVERGDVLIVKAGESIPVDGAVLEGGGSVDESAITGESIPWKSAPATRSSGPPSTRAAGSKCGPKKSATRPPSPRSSAWWTRPPAPRPPSPSWLTKWPAFSCRRSSPRR